MKTQKNPKFLRKQTEKNWVGRNVFFRSSLHNFWPKTVYLAEAKLQATVKVIL